MRNKCLTILLSAFLVFVLFGCNSNSQQSLASAQKDTLVVYVDTSLAILINEQRKAYENDYVNPIVQLKYLQEASIIKSLMSNEVNCAILQRKLTEGEKQFFQKKEDFLPKEYVIAHDAFVFIANKENVRDRLYASEIKDYFVKGTIKEFQFVFENNSCQAIPYFRAYYGLSDKQLSSAYSKNGLTDLVQFLKTDSYSIGIIPFSYIADIEAQSTIEMLKGLKVLSVKYSDSSNRELTVNPSQESITTKDYPYTMPIVLLNCNMEKKSGTTFVNYIFKPKAQRLFLKCGMVPAIFPGREVIVNTN